MFKPLVAGAAGFNEVFKITVNFCRVPFNKPLGYYINFLIGKRDQG